MTADRDERTVETALTLRQALDAGVPVVAPSIARVRGGWISSRTSLTPSAVNLAVFRTLEETCSVELIEGGSFEAVAHEIHRRYRQMQPTDGEPSPPWSELDELLKKSSRAQARHVSVKLRSIGCEITPLRYWHAKDFTFTNDELDRLTLMEHDRWRQEKEADGWTLGPKDVKRKKHPDLVPWADLPPDVADWDRQFVLAIPEMLAAVGLQIVDLHGTSPRYPTSST